MRGKPKYLQPSCENRQSQQGGCRVTTYPLSAGDPEAGAWDLREGLNGWSGGDLVVLDVNRGEPVWLKWVLDRLVGAKAPVVIVPKGKVNPATLKALRQAQASNAEGLARACGYEV